MKLRLFLLVIINIIFITSTAQAFQIDIAEKYNKIFTNKILDDEDVYNYQQAYIYQEQCNW